MESKYLKFVKDALEHMPYNFREVKRDGDGSVQYATEISNTRGMLTKTMDIIVDEKQNSIVMRSCLEKNVPDIMRPKVYEWINEMQNKWYFVRMYLNQEGELMADYKITLKRAEASLVFQENVIEVVKSVVHVTLQYASAAFKIIHDSKDIGTKLTVKQVNLNPFEGGSCYGI